MGLDRIRYIKEKYTVLEYARDVLCLPVRNSGDRCVSLAPGSSNPTALVVYDDYWKDFKTGAGGDVIDLCAEAKHGGDRGAAIRELSGDYGHDYDWLDYTQRLNDKIAYFHSKLRESDIHYLNRRGIRQETIDRLRLGYDEQEDRLTIPYYKNGYVAYYISRDRSGEAGVSKYKKAKLDGYNENIPWGLHTLMPSFRECAQKQLSERLDTVPEFIEDTLIIAEGAFDAMSFEQEGFRVLSPISGYFNAESLKQVVNIAQSHKMSFICFDNDSAGSRFQVTMAKTFFKHRIHFVCGKLPEKYKDVSEYYEAGGDLIELVNGATSGISNLAERITDRDEFKAFVYDAARFVDEPELTELFESVTQFPELWLKSVKKKALRAPNELMITREILDKHKLKHVEGLGFFEYIHGVWTHRIDNIVRNYISASLGHWATGVKLDSVLKLLKARTISEEMFNRQAIFNFRNGVLDLETGEFKDHNEVFMSSIQVPYDYDENAKCPLWEKFVREVMAEREASIKVLQEAAGYVLFNDCSLQKCFFFQGEGANGKSVTLNVLSEVFGHDNVSNVEMSALIEPFQRIALMTSLVNISTETSTNVKGAESIFKQIVAGDIINACYKNKDFITGRPRCKMFASCNEYIKSKDTSTGFMRRMCFIDFPCKFEGERADPDLERKLLTELSGIFNWCYEGYKRLREQRHFTETTEQAEMLDEFIQITNPVAAFIREELSGENGSLDRTQLYRRYVSWAKEAGHEPQSRTKFIRSFRLTLKQIRPEVSEKKLGINRYFIFNQDDLPDRKEFE